MCHAQRKTCFFTGGLRVWGQDKNIQEPHKYIHTVISALKTAQRAAGRNQWEELGLRVRKWPSWRVITLGLNCSGSQVKTQAEFSGLDRGEFTKKP